MVSEIIKPLTLSDYYIKLFSLTIKYNKFSPYISNFLGELNIQPNIYLSEFYHFICNTHCPLTLYITVINFLCYKSFLWFISTPVFLSLSFVLVITMQVVTMLSYKVVYNSKHTKWQLFGFLGFIPASATSQISTDIKC